MFFKPKTEAFRRFGLEGQSVSVATGEVEDRLRPLCLQQGTYGKGTQSHDRILEVWDIDDVARGPSRRSAYSKSSERSVALGWLEFRDDNEFP